MSHRSMSDSADTDPLPQSLTGNQGRQYHPLLVISVIAHLGQPFRPVGIESSHVLPMSTYLHWIQSAALNEGTAQGLYGFAVGLADEDVRSSELEANKHLVVAHQTLSILRMAVPLPTDELHDPLYDPLGMDQFGLTNWGGPDTYLLSDKHNYDDYIVYYSQLCNPSFDIVAWLVDLKLHNYQNLIVKKLSFKPTWSNRVIPEGMTHSGGDLYLDEPPNSGYKEPDSTYCDEWVTMDEEEDIEMSLPAQIIPDDDQVLALLSCKSSDEDDSDETGELFCGMVNPSKTDLPDLRSLQRQAA
ncbi:hypothetical protein F4604DRAFT_1934407 [Suillus subluteus]|nr:hypothetical protein F4604DRAFT_1934407 [Suillus subluteus]